MLVQVLECDWKSLEEDLELEYVLEEVEFEEGNPLRWRSSMIIGTES